MHWDGICRDKIPQNVLKRHGWHMKSAIGVTFGVMAESCVVGTKSDSKSGADCVEKGTSTIRSTTTLHKGLNANDPCEFENWPLMREIHAKMRVRDLST